MQQYIKEGNLLVGSVWSFKQTERKRIYYNFLETFLAIYQKDLLPLELERILSLICLFNLDIIESIASQSMSQSLFKKWSLGGQQIGLSGDLEVWYLANQCGDKHRLRQADEIMFAIQNRNVIDD